MSRCDRIEPWWRALVRGVAGTRAGTAVKQYLFPFYLAAAHSVLPVAILRGPTRPSGRPGSVAVAGKDPWARYLPDRVFLDPPRREEIRRVPIWSLARELRLLRPSVDLVLARVEKRSARRFFGADFLHVPEWTQNWLDVPEDAATVMKRSGSVRDDLRIVRKNRLRPRISRQEADFEEFYRDMYVPFAHNRHGEFSHPADFHRLRESFRHGGLIWVERDGERIAGGVFAQHGKTLHFRALGTLRGDPAVMRQGGIAALYCFLLEQARQRRCAQVDLGTSRSLLQDGVLRYKRKWGAAVAEAPSTRFEVLLGWRRFHGVVADFLSHTSPIFREANGISALHVLSTARPANSEEAQNAYRSLWIPGLHRLFLVATAGWEPEAVSPSSTILLPCGEETDLSPPYLASVG